MLILKKDSLVRECVTCIIKLKATNAVVVVLLFYAHSKYLRSCWDGQLT